MQDYSSKTCCVVDNGLFVETAVTLSKSFGRVYYTCNSWATAFPKTKLTRIGKGIPGVTRVESIWDVLDEVDLFVFPDIYEGPLQEHLASLGKRVWGSRRGDEIEIYRPDAKTLMEGLGLPIGPWTKVRGLDALRDHLRHRTEQWVKGSRTRGDFESFRAKNYSYIKPRLDAIARELGRDQDVHEFIIEGRIADAVEVGYDGYSVDGSFPKAACCGVETKSKGYVGHFLPASAMPEQLTRINEAMAPTLKEYGYKNFFAVEARITADGTPWIIDPCCRQGSPPSEMLLEMYTNLADIFWYGAEGECIDPVPAGEWGAELMLHSTWAENEWLPIQFPDEDRAAVKLRNCTRINGEYNVMPGTVGTSEVGAVVAVGNSMQQAIKRCCEVAERVQGYYLDVEPEALTKASEQFAELKRFGVTL